MSDDMNGRVAETPGWIALQAPDEVVALLERMAEQDAAAQKERVNKSAFVRRLIVKEARERGLLAAEEAAQ